MKSLWKRHINLDEINAAGEGRANGVLGVRITAVENNSVRGEMAIESRVHQGYGILHGGVSCVLAETLGSVGSLLACDEDHYPVGVDINATHMNGIKSGAVIGIATPLKIGSRLHVWSINIESEDGLPICAARLTTAILKK
ncbi:hotdog fold thioesterase [Spongiibacter sp. UBA1325]|jgi:uncharacterized protein (TIGR00369 family)|uniref:hotdog fold thioesterase n=1 Tax=Spongiibacter sp. UBA1325 TaxID=1947543 RepID=UPI00257B8334|nr:hotdog fold thioesterase [Spongiibacter sp. UBA1325]|tara:strand:+ start:8097 stop:8519 length:423 start_codon:yes stop_codon:yes gene_type:complete